MGRRRLLIPAVDSSFLPNSPIDGAPRIFDNNKDGRQENQAQLGAVPSVDLREEQLGCKEPSQQLGSGAGKEGVDVL